MAFQHGSITNPPAIKMFGIIIFTFFRDIEMIAYIPRMGING